MAIFTALIPLIVMLGRWLLERDLMSIEAKKHFLEWVKQTSKDGAISAEMSASYDQMMRDHDELIRKQKEAENENTDQ